jgi:hypothetical protein
MLATPNAKQCGRDVEAKTSDVDMDTTFAESDS